MVSLTVHAPLRSLCRPKQSRVPPLYKSCCDHSWLKNLLIHYEHIKTTLLNLYLSLLSFLGILITFKIFISLRESPLFALADLEIAMLAKFPSASSAGIKEIMV